MELIVTAEIAQRAKLAGACTVPKVGRRIDAIPQDDLRWAAEHGVVDQAEIDAAIGVGGIPLELLARSGSGSGYGYGYGDGYGDGSGYGDGDGYGSGYGDGDGYGDGE